MKLTNLKFRHIEYFLCVDTFRVYMTRILNLLKTQQNMLKQKKFCKWFHIDVNTIIQYTH